MTDDLKIGYLDTTDKTADGEDDWKATAHRRRAVGYKVYWMYERERLTAAVLATALEATGMSRDGIQNLVTMAQTSVEVTAAKARFLPGCVVLTPGAVELLGKFLPITAQSLIPITAQSLIDRHLSGDWGEVREWHARTNEEALETGARVMSVYPINDHKIWVITEADRSSTTMLLPEEYG